MVESLKPVDRAILGFEELSFKDAITSIKPDIVAVGYDQTSIEEDVRKAVSDMKYNVQVLRIGKFRLSDLDSSSKIRRRIVEETV